MNILEFLNHVCFGVLVFLITEIDSHQNGSQMFKSIKFTMLIHMACEVKREGCEVDFLISKQVNKQTLFKLFNYVSLLTLYGEELLPVFQSHNQQYGNQL